MPDVLDTKVYDEVIAVENDDAFATGRLIGHKEGVLVGISSGAAVFAAAQLAKRPENAGKVIVALLPEEKRKSPDELIFKVVMQDGGDSCKVNLPLAMISALSKTGMNVFSFTMGDSEMAKNLSNIDLGQVLSLAEAGVVGKLVEMRGSDGEMIDVYM